MSQDSAILEKPKPTQFRTGPDSLEDGSVVLAWNVLLQAINDFLIPPPLPTSKADLDPEVLALVICSCSPCPLELWLQDEDVDDLSLAHCERLQFMRRLPQWDAETWLTSRNEHPYSYRWTCALFGVNADFLLERILKMPKGRRLETSSGQRLYRHNRTSYDVATQRSKSKKRKMDEESYFKLACAVGLMDML